VPLVAQPGQPSTLAVVIQQVIDAFAELGDATPIMVGKHYLEHLGAGFGPRVLFVPEAGAGRIDRPINLGNAASVVHSCDVYVRGPETGSDVSRFDAVYYLADLVINALITAAPGRIEWGSLRDDSPVNVDMLGAGLVFSFTYSRDVTHAPQPAGDRGRWNLAAAAASSAIARNMLPSNRGGAGSALPDDSAAVETVDVVTIPEP
jgi:hypothetical protein